MKEPIAGENGNPLRYEYLSEADDFRWDWKELYTRSQVKKEMGIDLTEPGWYIGTDGSATLILPTRRTNSSSERTRDNELFSVYVYDGRNPFTAFNQIINAPVRADLRPKS